jgi:tRNA threonylcarbamoyladenosine biosynthesis protein TsaB
LAIAEDGIVLAVDTATRLAGLALYSESQVLAEETWRSFGNHTVELMPALARMLERARLQPEDLAGLVVSIGPGSYTGLRIGLAVVKGLALALKIPTVGVSALDAVAHAHAQRGLPAWAVVEAGRERYAAALYGVRKGQWQRLTPYQIAYLDALAPHDQRKTLYCGELDGAALKMLRESFTDLAILPTVAATLRRPAFLAELGWQRLAAGEEDDVVSLSPIYLQYPVPEAAA